jgi:hypothetical protein
MPRLFNRDIAVTVGTTRIASRSASDPTLAKPTLRMSFVIEKSLSQEPNKVELRIWNLNPEHRALFQPQTTMPVIIEAGYVGGTQELFNGDMGKTNHVREGMDWITTMEAADGQQKYRSSRINESFGPGAKLEDVINAVAQRMGVGMGNVSKKLREGNFRGGLTQFTTGISVVGKCSDVLAKLLATAGFGYSIQSGQLQLLRLDAIETTQDEAVMLDLASGLVGTPERGEKGFVKSRSLLQGIIAPGREVVILPLRQERMRLRVEKVTHTGDTWGTDWYSDIEGRLL